jgi:hypothetical protein
MSNDPRSLRGCAAGRPTISKAPIAGYFHALFTPKSHEIPGTLYLIIDDDFIKKLELVLI